MEKEVKQVDSLIPLLFIILLARIVKETIKSQQLVGYNRLQPIKKGILLYADDMVLIANSYLKMKTLVEIWTTD